MFDAQRIALAAVTDLEADGFLFIEGPEDRAEVLSILKVHFREAYAQGTQSTESVSPEQVSPDPSR
jgi:hypothetical protein